MSERGLSPEALVNACLHDDTVVLRSFFSYHGAELKAFRWSPERECCDHALLQYVRNYWHGLKGPTGQVAASAISPFGLKPALGYIVLVDMLEDGRNGVFRLYGTKVADAYGRDMTGCLVSDIDDGNYVARFFCALYLAVMMRGEPVFTHHVPPEHTSVTSWRRLCLPLAKPDRTIGRILTVNIPGAWRPPGLPG